MTTGIRTPKPWLETLRLSMREFTPDDFDDLFGLDTDPRVMKYISRGKPATRAEVEDLICEHSLMYSRGVLGFDTFTEDERRNFRPVRQRLVRTHPVTARKSLYLSSHIGGIVGWPMPEARAFIRDLTEFATQRQFVHAHEWRVGDLVIWDNRTTMHRARRYPDTGEVRDMRRTTITGDGPTAEQIAA